MKFSASRIAELINGTIEGDPEVEVDYVSKIEEGKPGTISFLANPKYTQYIYNTKASIVIVNRDFKSEKEISATLIRVDDAYTAFAALLDHYNKIKFQKSGISPKAFVAENASMGRDVYVGEFAVISENSRIGDNARIYPQVFIGDNVTIGNNTTIYPGAKIYADSRIGNNCIIHAGVVIGSDGFGFAPQSESNFMKIAQIGNVILEDDVEIGSNTTIDRATLGSTIIRKGAKIDNLVQIAHNVEIGENTVIAAQTGISGSTKVGKNCMFGGQVGLIGHITIADDVKIAAQSGIGKNITKPGSIYQGSPAFEIGDYRKSYIHFKNLHHLKTKVDELEKKIEQD